MKTKSKVGRPREYGDDSTFLAIDTANSKTKVQRGSERRAIINHLIDCGGRATFRQLNDHFGFSVRQQVLSLIKAGWLKQVEQ